MRYRRTAIALGVVAAALLVLVPVTTLLNNREADRRLERPFTTNVDPFAELAGNSSFSGLLLMGNITSVDSPGLSFKIHFSGIVLGAYAESNPGDVVYNRFNTDARLLITGKETVFKQGASIPPFDITVPIAEGQPNRYPFDVYATEFEITLLYKDSYNQTIPMAVALVGAVQSWSTKLNINDLQSGQRLVRVHAEFRRSWTTQLFSIIVVIIMWALSLSVFTLSVTLWLRDRKVEPPTIGVIGSLLFALPALRNSQPGAPPIGGSVDVAGFMWNMALVAVACLLLVINYIVKYGKERPASNKTGPEAMHLMEQGKPA
ncbi:hypothetical protein HK105_203583 [Polyrhizophydium stewartii]|uniref:DUF4436 domain-containing protein n=1 Tax=Polyrhizophydium stewartii TaxID=2732419 RepID=A0ABR4NBJ2_9FUNG|nr:hypothetical protein HK105_000302 [Polyrhizophydium stewartii]